MRHSVSRASSAIAMLHRHGRTPTDGEVLDAYQELVAAKIERCIVEADPRGLPLDAARVSGLMDTLLQTTTPESAPA